MLGDTAPTLAPLCGHSQTRQRVCDLQETVSLCTPCFHKLRQYQRDFTDGRTSKAETIERMSQVVGIKEAREHVQYLQRALRPRRGRLIPGWLG